MNPATSALNQVLLDKVMALPRVGSADEIAAMVAYLASPETAFIHRGQPQYRRRLYRLRRPRPLLGRI